jgi:hypothetical protein
MEPTAAELNLLVMLRLRKPYEVVTIKFDHNGKPNLWRINIEQNLIISDEGIKETK